ncbi:MULTISPECIES: hypothetical protein [unclassified Streptomyces]|uniref:hypothetical protein n=1 Tax=unclassified Streptomyces TaxID=2593676 RepID=UPI00115FE005|nr:MULTISPECIES: hypothetical protein [unclassified Streptomyces]
MTNGFPLMAADIPRGMEHRPGNNIAVSLSGDGADEVRGYWDALPQHRRMRPTPCHGSLLQLW